VGHLLEQNTLTAAREAVLLAPTNAAALAHLSRMLFTFGSNSPVTFSEAQFLRDRADGLAPNDVGVPATLRRVTP
jgi:hypothetical protein